MHVYQAFIDIRLHPGFTTSFITVAARVSRHLRSRAHYGQTWRHP